MNEQELEQYLKNAKNAFIGYHVDALGIQGAATTFDTMIETIQQQARDKALHDAMKTSPGE